MSAAIAASIAFACLAGVPAQAVPTGPDRSRWERLENNVSALATADDPDAVWAAMPTAEQDEVSQEFDDATVSVDVVDDAGAASPAPTASAAPTGGSRAAAADARAAAFSGCWSRSIESTFKGGLTKKKMFGVGQRTEVCVKSKKVTSVKVISPYAKTYGYPGISVGKPTTGTYNASWEGRGVARVEATLGVTIPKVGTIGSKRTICAKLYLNANGSSLRGSEECQA